MLLRCKRGFSALEVIATLTIAAAILSVAMAGAQARIKRANVGRTVNEMAALADAAINYKEANGFCPPDISDLVPSYIKAAPVKNVFGQAYSLICMNGMVTVSSNVPTGAAQDTSLGSLLEVVSAGSYDTIKITKRSPIGASGRLLYGKKNL
jgi:prepilin-type N-terminal cleavage/methylation domain-containing protein